MMTGNASTTRKELYDRHNMPTRGRLFVSFLLPIIEWAIEVEADVETELHDEVLAEIALWQAFEREPKVKPLFLVITGLLFYDYLYYLPFGVYGLVIVGLGTLGGLAVSIRGRHLLAAEFSNATDKNGMPADLMFRATNVANSAVTLVYVGGGIAVQMMGTSELVGAEVLQQNRLAGGPIPSIVVIVILVALLPAFGQILNRR